MRVRNIGAYIAPRFGGFVNATAAGAGDATEVDGVWIDRQDFFSASVVLSYTATLQQAETLTLVSNVQDASDSSGTGAADYGAVYASAVVATGDTGGSTEVGAVKYNVDFLGGTQGAADGTAADRYIRVQFTPDLSASGTDTADVMAVVILGGAEDAPAV